MPAVIAPSPITATVFDGLPRAFLAKAMPKPALIEVEECPTPKVSKGLSSLDGKGAKPSLRLKEPICSRRPVKILCG